MEGREDLAERAFPEHLVESIPTGEHFADCGKGAQTELRTAGRIIPMDGRANGSMWDEFVR